MSNGKANAQSGHAYVEAILQALQSPNGAAYAQLHPGTKVSLDGKSEAHMLYLYDRLIADGFNVVVINDEDHVELPDFDGTKTLTALGVGPIYPRDRPSYLKKLKLWTGSPGRETAVHHPQQQIQQLCQPAQHNL